jgi:hypothetical protein
MLHVGLALLLVIAPALCCCNVRLVGQLFAAPAKAAPCPACPQPEESLPACCQTAKKANKASCCREAEPNQSPNKNPSQPPYPKQDRCDSCCERPDAAPPESAPKVASPEPTGEIVPLAILSVATFTPEHLGLLDGLHQTERAGVDARSESLFSRHVLRC